MASPQGFDTPVEVTAHAWLRAAGVKRIRSAYSTPNAHDSPTVVRPERVRGVPRRLQPKRHFRDDIVVVISDPGKQTTLLW
jgi:hypothetical protein